MVRGERLWNGAEGYYTMKWAIGDIKKSPILSRTVNYDAPHHDSLLARHSSNKFDSALAALRNCQLLQHRARPKIKLFYSAGSAPKGSVAHLSHFGHTFVTHLSHAM